MAKEREILAEAARKEGKPEKIIAKMVEGRLQGLLRRALPAGAAVRQGRQARRVGKVAKEAGMKIVRSSTGNWPRSKPHVVAEGSRAPSRAIAAWC